MGTKFYFVAKDKPRKRALIVQLGKFFDMSASDTDIEIIDNTIDEVERLLDKARLTGLDKKKLNEITVGQLADLVTLKDLMNRITKETDISDELGKVLRVYGLVKTLVHDRNMKEFEWSVVNEFILYGFDDNDEGVMGELKKEGYKIIFWGWGDED